MPATYDQIRGHLAALREFTGHSMRAVREPDSFTSLTLGQLQYDEWLELRSEFRVFGTVRYLVFSYQTPIAWVTMDGTISVPEVQYSPTTSRQQNICRTYLRPNPTLVDFSRCPRTPARQSERGLLHRDHRHRRSFPSPAPCRLRIISPE